MSGFGRETMQTGIRQSTHLNKNNSIPLIAFQSADIFNLNKQHDTFNFDSEPDLS